MSDENYPHGEEFQRRTTHTLQITSATRLPGTWMTAERVIIQMADMKNSHLRNTIEMLRRKSLHRLSQLAESVEFEPSHLFNADERALAAWGEVYHELLEEALSRSDGDLEEWMTR